MKILITGCNKLQTTENFYLRQQLNVVPSHYSLIRCLRDMGYTVEQRLVEIGEDLSDYDEVIVFLASPRQALQLAFYNGLWAIAARPNCVLAFDDWQVEDIFKGIASCDCAENLLKEFTINQNKMCDPKCSRELLKPYTEALLQAVRQISLKSNRLLISAFAGGDLSRLISYPVGLITRYNPNPYHRNRRPGDYGDIEIDQLPEMEQLLVPSVENDFIDPSAKERKFNFSSLVQGKTAKWLKKQRVTWPIEHFGSRKEKQVRLTEGDMARVYARQWGCLMPGYDHAGSGWWRARPLQVADAHSILIGEPAEMYVYYRDHKLAGLKASDIESLSNKELESIALLQKKLLYKYHPLDKMVQQRELSPILP